MHLHVLMTTALWPIGVKLQLPFVGRFFEGQLNAPLRWDPRTTTQSSPKERTQLQTVELGWRAARTGLRTIVAATPGDQPPESRFCIRWRNASMRAILALMASFTVVFWSAEKVP